MKSSNSQADNRVVPRSGGSFKPFSSTSVEPNLQPVIERAFEAAWRELQLTPGQVLSPHEKSTRAALARRIKAAAAKGERDPLRLKLMALRAYRPGLPLG